MSQRETCPRSQRLGGLVSEKEPAAAGGAMFLNTASPRRSFSIPININLQGARRRQTRELPHMVPEHWSGGWDGRGAQRARTQILVSSVGEDRAILLGFAMMAFSVLMFFVVGITVVKPFNNSHWEEEAACVLVRADILPEWVDCRGVSAVPCLRATVNLTGSNQSALLHFDEESLLLAPECFYVPKCQMDSADLQAEVQRVKEVLDTRLGSNWSCFADRAGHPGVVLLSRKHTREKALLALLWPCLTLGGGALLVALVKLTQRLARLSAETCGEAAGSRPAAAGDAQGRVYRLLRGSSVNSPS